MKHLFAILLSLSLVFAPQYASAVALSCADALLEKKTLEVDRVERWSSEDVEIIFFPTGHHTKLRIGEDVYGNECPGGRCVHTSYKAIEKLSALGSGVQFRFKIKVTEAELDQLRSYIEEGHFGGKWDLSCTHSACKAINKSTKAWIPPPFNFLPASNALFMAVSRVLPWTRVEKMRVTNPKNSNTFQNVAGSSLSLTEGLYFSTLLSFASYEAVHGLISFIPIP